MSRAFPRIIFVVASLLSAAPAAAADKIQLANGDELSGVIVESLDERVVLEHPVLGRIELERSQLLPEAPADDGAFGTGFLLDWDRSFEFGISGSEGNTEDLDIRAGIALSFEDDDKRWVFDARYLRGSDDGDTNEHEAHARLERDWRLSDSPWFAFANGTFDWDEFEDWDFRASLFAGPGYEFYHTDTFKLRGRVGPGVIREFGSGEGFSPELLIGIETEWIPGDRQKITAFNRVFPDLSDLGEVRNVSGADYTVDVGAEGGLKLKVGLENEYDSDVGGDSRQNDLKYYGTVLVGF